MNHERMQRRVIASVITLTMIVLFTFFYVGTLDYAQDRTRALLRTVEQETGLRIKITEHQFNMHGARFDDVSIDRGEVGKIGSILAELGLNPFGAQFGRIKKLRIKDLNINTDMTYLHNYLQTRLKQKTKETNEEKRGKRRLPQEVLLNNAHIQIHDYNKQLLLTLDDVDAQLALKDGKLIFRIAAIHYRNEQLTGEISGQVDIIDTLSYLPFSIESNEHEHSWQISGKLKRDFTGLNLATSFRGLKGPLADFIRRVVPRPETLAGSVSATFAIDRPRNQIRYLTNIDIKQGTFYHPVAAAQPFALPMRLKARGSAALDASQFSIDDGLIAVRGDDENNLVDKIKIWFNAKHAKTPHNNKLDVAIHIPTTRCQDALDALPDNAAASIKDFSLGGDLQVAANLSMDLQTPEKFALNVSDYNWTCYAAKTPFAYSRERLAQSFLFQNPYEAGVTRAIDTNTSNAQYTSLSQITENVKLAVLGAEDLNYWAHNGFETNQLINALRENLKQQRIAIGGSTITMQAAKNLFLNRERTLTRKMQEAFFTWHLEQILSKERILEIYLNIIEFGPGIYGITQAARHYFNKLPTDLSLLESTYLISTLPSPVQRYHNFCNGKVSPNYQDMLDKRLERMLKFDLITASELQTAKRDRLHFSDAHLYSKESCLAKIARLSPAVSLR